MKCKLEKKQYVINNMTCAENFRGGQTFVTIVLCHKSTLGGRSGGMSPGNVCKITRKNTHFCTFWKQVLVQAHSQGGGQCPLQFRTLHQIFSG